MMELLKCSIHPDVKKEIDNGSDKLNGRKHLIKLVHEARKQFKKLLSGDNSITKSKDNSSSSSSSGCKKQSKSCFSSSSSSPSKKKNGKKRRKMDYYSNEDVRRESLESSWLSQLIMERAVHPDYWIRDQLTQADIDSVFDIGSPLTGYSCSQQKRTPAPKGSHLDLLEDLENISPPRPPKNFNAVNSYGSSNQIEEQNLEKKPWKKYCENFGHLFAGLETIVEEPASEC